MRKVNLIYIMVFAVLCQLNLYATDAADSHPYEQITIISDLDDTIKITNTTDTWATIGNALYSTDIFSGTDTLYRKLVPADKGFYLLSASPTFLLRKVENLLTVHNMPTAEITLRSVIYQRDKHAYKLTAVRAMIDNSPESEQFILLGDDSDLDPEVYAQISDEYPGRVIATYIHPVKGRDLSELEDMKIFHTPFDIALYEEMAGRLDAKWIVDLGIELLQAPAKLLYPPFMSCDQLAMIPSPHDSQDRLAQIANQVTKRIESICKK
jgi:hypothetical protein